MIDCSSRSQPEVFEVDEFVIFVGKVEVEVGKERNGHCCFILLLTHQVFDSSPTREVSFQIESLYL